ncbi:hypothetical protein G7007_09320 [Pseudomonas entomophila]|uniref:caspase family protein n=1 Tax=Pseudomonas entomophila TaxID=312306 RepID=UPI0015E3BAAD|nr:caspase family protein [Pseudomonas entomophila]MBA1193059.1 hypothetical protein [Pseudomonas entomophila]
MIAVLDDSTDSPGTHALVIGISAYEHLVGTKGVTSEQGQESGLGQLTAPARSASCFANWLMDGYRRKDAPLKSLRVLLAPVSEDEVPENLKHLLGSGSIPNRKNVGQAFSQFRIAAASHPDNVAIVYVAGHGIQFTTTGAVLLLNDFADPDHEHERYRGAVDMRAMHESMTYDDNAKSQFWFVDICRQRPPEASEFEKLAGVLKHDKKIIGAVPCSPLFLAASTGEQAFARIGQLTLFCEALMLALAEGHAASSEGERASPWLVTTSGLQMFLRRTVKLLADERDESQLTECTGVFNDEIFHECVSAPAVDLTVQVKSGLPAFDYMAKISQLDRILFDNHCEWPLNTRVPAGLYKIEVTTLSTSEKDSDHLNLTPPSRLRELPL